MAEWIDFMERNLRMSWAQRFLATTSLSLSFAAMVVVYYQGRIFMVALSLVGILLGARVHQLHFATKLKLKECLRRMQEEYDRLPLHEQRAFDEYVRMRWSGSNGGPKFGPEERR